ncbi:MAG TPA: transposase family protein [Cellvibrionaceae bacterium]
MPTVGPVWSMPLKGVRLRYMQEQANRLTIGLETEPRSIVCAACASREVVGYGRMTWRIRDLPIEHKSVLLEISRRRLRCKECKITFNEPVANIAEAHRTTARLAQRLWQLGLYYPFTALAPKFGLDEKTLRGIFSDRFAQMMAQFNRQMYSQAPRILVLHRPIIQRQHRLLWLNADLDTLVDLNPLVTADRVLMSLERLGLQQPQAQAQIWLPPEAPLLRLLQAQLPSTSNIVLRLHPAAVRRHLQALACTLGLSASSANEGLQQALERVATAPDANAAMLAWQQALNEPHPAELATALIEFKTVLTLLGTQALASFDEPALPCDPLLEQLDATLSTSLVKRSFDAVCAMLLFDKTLQVSARTGLARDGTRLGYQKTHYGTSLPRLLAKLNQLPRL